VCAILNTQGHPASADGVAGADPTGRRASETKETTTVPPNSAASTSTAVHFPRYVEVDREPIAALPTLPASLERLIRHSRRFGCERVYEVAQAEAVLTASELAHLSRELSTPRIGAMPARWSSGCAPATESRRAS
jgi:hypothetical protein